MLHCTAPTQYGIPPTGPAYACARPADHLLYVTLFSRVHVLARCRRHTLAALLDKATIAANPAYVVSITAVRSMIRFAETTVYQGMPW
jgi:hypothetical protein